MPDVFPDTHYAFDGESLLQRLPRNVGRTFDEICQSSKHYLLNKHGTVENITVVFDGGFLVPFIKGSKHISRYKGRLGTKIVPSLHNPLTLKKVTFFYMNIISKLFLKCLGLSCQLLLLA